LNAAPTSAADNASAWGLPRVVDFFSSHRNTSEQVYDSEWFFLKDRLSEGMSVLDVGSALGGFAAILAEHLGEFRYTGVDISAEMVARARELHPDHAFQHVAEGDLSALGDQRYDLVLVLGILHLHEAWRETIREAWAHTGGCLILDIRQCAGASIEDRARSWFQMDFNGGGDSHQRARLSYNVINAGRRSAPSMGCARVPRASPITATSTLSRRRRPARSNGRWRRHGELSERRDGRAKPGATHADLPRGCVDA